MVGCSAYACKNTSELGFRMRIFPKDPERRKSWEALLSKDDKSSQNPYLYICETHFEPEMWEEAHGSKKLKNNAIPTILSPKTCQTYELSSSFPQMENNAEIVSRYNNYQIEEVVTSHGGEPTDITDISKEALADIIGVVHKSSVKAFQKQSNANEPVPKIKCLRSFNATRLKNQKNALLNKSGDGKRTEVNENKQKQSVFGEVETFSVIKKVISDATSKTPDNSKISELKVFSKTPYKKIQADTDDILDLIRTLESPEHKATKSEYLSLGIGNNISPQIKKVSTETEVGEFEDKISEKLSKKKTKSIISKMKDNQDSLKSTNEELISKEMKLIFSEGVNATSDEENNITGGNQNRNIERKDHSKASEITDTKNTTTRNMTREISKKDKTLEQNISNHLIQVSLESGSSGTLSQSKTLKVKIKSRPKRSLLSDLNRKSITTIENTPTNGYNSQSKKFKHYKNVGGCTKEPVEDVLEQDVSDNSLELNSSGEQLSIENKTSKAQNVTSSENIEQKNVPSDTFDDSLSNECKAACDKQEEIKILQNSADILQKEKSDQKKLILNNDELNASKESTGKKIEIEADDLIRLIKLLGSPALQDVLTKTINNESADECTLLKEKSTFHSNQRRLMDDDDRSGNITKVRSSTEHREGNLLATSSKQHEVTSNIDRSRNGKASPEKRTRENKYSKSPLKKLRLMKENSNSAEGCVVKTSTEPLPCEESSGAPIEANKSHIILETENTGKLNSGLKRNRKTKDLELSSNNLLHLKGLRDDSSNSADACTAKSSPKWKSSPKEYNAELPNQMVRQYSNQRQHLTKDNSKIEKTSTTDYDWFRGFDPHGNISCESKACISMKDLTNQTKGPNSSRSNIDLMEDRTLENYFTHNYGYNNFMHTTPEDLEEPKEGGAEFIVRHFKKEPGTVETPTISPIQSGQVGNGTRDKDKLTCKKDLTWLGYRKYTSRKKTSAKGSSRINSSGIRRTKGKIGSESRVSKRKTFENTRSEQLYESDDEGGNTDESDMNVSKTKITESSGSEHDSNDDDEDGRMRQMEKRTAKYKKDYKEALAKSTSYRDALTDARSTIRNLELRLNNLKGNKYYKLLKQYFNDDQIEVLEGTTNKITWSDSTITKALKLRFACGNDGYEELIKHLPLPCLKTLRRRVDGLEFNIDLVKEVIKS